MYFGLTMLLVLVIFLLNGGKSEEDWVWKKESDRTSRRIGGRYEIYEPDAEFPQRPIQTGNYQPPPPPQIPDFADRYPQQNGNYPNHPDHLTNGFLVGPSYGRGPFRHIDSCTCTERFNCRGLAYGVCDTAKQYCCVGGKSGASPSRPSHTPDRGVLVGPGGGAPFHPGYGFAGIPRKQGFGVEGGVLVGPGRPRSHREA